MSRVLVKLEDILEVNPSSWSKKTEWTYLRYLDTSNITNGQIDKIITFDTKTDKIPSRARRIVQNGDFIYSTVRPNQKHYGLLKNIENNLVVSTGFAVMRSKHPEQFDTRFIFLLLTQDFITNYLHAIAENNTSAYPALRPKDITDLEFKIPPISDQKLVADFIENLDDKIEHNQKINKTLEEIAKTLFKSWFIDFDPVRAKAEGRPTGLSKEISDLFPDSFEDSELGEIPKGWEVKALDEIAEFLNGLALQKYPEDAECPRYPVLKIAQLREGSTKSQDVFSSNIPDEYIVRNGDYIFSWSGSLLAKFWLGGDAALNQHLFKVTSENYPNWFFAGWVEKHLGMFSSIASSKATTMGHIKRGDLKDAKTVTPPIELISSFGECFSPLREKANLCFLENNNLADLRDTLLPKLISGEIKIPDSDSFIKQVGV